MHINRAFVPGTWGWGREEELLRRASLEFYLFQTFRWDLTWRFRRPFWLGLMSGIRDPLIFFWFTLWLPAKTRQIAWDWRKTFFSVSELLQGDQDQHSQFKADIFDVTFNKLPILYECVLCTWQMEKLQFTLWAGVELSNPDEDACSTCQLLIQVSDCTWLVL